MITLLMLGFGCRSPTPTPEPTDVPSQDTAPPTPTAEDTAWPAPTEPPPLPRFVLTKVLQAENCPGVGGAHCRVVGGPQRLSSTTVASGQSRQPSFMEFEPYEPTTLLFSARDGSSTIDCAMVADIDGVRLCASGDGYTGAFEVGPLDQPEKRWTLGESAFFFGCDPNGDGVQALCTGEGADEAPFDGELDVRWEHPLPTARVGLDLPGHPPLLFSEPGSTFIGGAPELMASLPVDASRPLHIGSVGGREVLVVASPAGVALVDVLPPYARRDLPLPPSSQLAVLGHFLPGEPVLLRLGSRATRGAVYSLEGDFLGAVQSFEYRYAGEPPIVLDRDGDGIDEVVVTDLESFFVLQLREP